MSKNKKPRNKTHNPNKRDCIPILFRFGADDERTLQLVPHQELSKLIAGDGDATSWHTITSRLNIGLTLAKAHFHGLPVETMLESLDAMCDVADRFKRIGKYGLSGDEARYIGAGLVTTDDMQLASTRRQMRDAIEHVMEVAT